jgi:hypothetical protein
MSHNETSYIAWRATFQSAEAAAKSAYAQLQEANALIRTLDEMAPPKTIEATVTPEKVFTITAGGLEFRGMREVGRVSLAVEYRDDQGRSIVLSAKPSSFSAQALSDVFGFPHFSTLVGASPDVLAEITKGTDGAQKGGA